METTSQEVQHLEIQLPEWLANSNDQIVIICDDGSGNTETENVNQQELVLPINTILDETEQSHAMEQMPVETQSSTVSSSELSTQEEEGQLPHDIPSSSEMEVVVQMPVKAQSSTAPSTAPPEQRTAEVRLPVKMTSFSSPTVIAEDKQAQESIKKVVDKDSISSCSSSNAIPVALTTASTETVAENELISEKAAGQSVIFVEYHTPKSTDLNMSKTCNDDDDQHTADKSQPQVEPNSNLMEHDYLAEKNSAKNDESKTGQHSTKNVLNQTERRSIEDKAPPAQVSRRSRRKAAMVPRRRWCHAGCCNDGKQHGEVQKIEQEISLETPTEVVKKSHLFEGTKGTADIEQPAARKSTDKALQNRKMDTSTSQSKDVTPAIKKKKINTSTSDQNDEKASPADPENIDSVKEQSTDDTLKNDTTSTNTKTNKTKKKVASKKLGNDAYTISPDGVDIDEQMMPHNIIKAAKPKDLCISDLLSSDVAVNTKFECICNQTFRQKKSLIRHFRRKNVRTDGVEESGSLHFSKYPIAIYPNTKAAKKKPRPTSYPCPHCPKVLKTKGGINYHLMSHTGFKPVTCSLCGESFKSKQILDQHFVIHTQNGELPHKCDKCGRTYLTASRLRAHQKIHGERRFKCTICDHAFVMNKDLKKHMRIHTGEKPFNCDFCSESFHFSQDRKRHLKSIHTDKAQYKCSFCPNQVFFKEEEYELHQKIHMDMDFNCEICLQNFPSYTTLRNHLMTHSDKNPFKCRYESCGLIFKTSNDRYLHERKLHDLNLMRCSFCKLSFKRRAAFEEHERKHAQATYECRVDPECGMKFRQAQVRLHHEKGHNKDSADKSKRKKGKKRFPLKPPDIPLEIQSTVYQCGVCWKTYKNYQALRDHVREHGDEMPYECRVAHCGHRFKRLYHRRKHEQTHSTNDIINSVLSTRMNTNNESREVEVVNGSEAEVPQQELVLVETDGTNIVGCGAEETEIAVQFVMHT